MSQAAVLGRQIAKLEMNIGFYREAACSTASSSNDEPRVSRTRSTEAPFTKMVHKVLELEEKAERLKNQCENLQSEIMGVIEELAKKDDRSISYIVNQSIKEFIKKSSSNGQTLEKAK